MPSFLHASCLSATESSFLSVSTLTFLTRAGCHLCDEARPIVLAEARRIGAEVEEVEIDTDDHLVALYGIRIPVVLGPDRIVLAEGIIADPKALRKRLRLL